MKDKTLFISYALEDMEYLKKFVEQAAKESFPFTFDYFAEKNPTSDTWRTECRDRIEKCEGVIVLMSKTIKASEGAFWEWKCSNEAAKQMVCIFTGNAGIIDKPLDLRSVTTMVLDLARLKTFFGLIP